MTPQTLSRFLAWVDSKIEWHGQFDGGTEYIDEAMDAKSKKEAFEQVRDYFMGPADTLSQDAVNADKDEPYA